MNITRFEMKLLLGIPAVILALVFVLWSIHLSLTLPVVYWSHTEAKCLKVESHNPEHACDNLPNRYHSVIVK